MWACATSPRVALRQPPLLARRGPTKSIGEVLTDVLHHPKPVLLESKGFHILAKQGVGVGLVRAHPLIRVNLPEGRHHQRDPLVVGGLGGRTPHGVLPVQEPGIVAQHNLHVCRKLPHDGAVEARIARAAGHLEIMPPRELQEELQDLEAGAFAFRILVLAAEKAVPARPLVGRLEPEVQRRVTSVAKMVSLHE